MEELSSLGLKTYVTAEPLMDFDLDEMVEYIRRCNPVQVNIGKESRGIKQFPHPSKQKVIALIKSVAKFTEQVVIKKNVFKNKGEEDWILYYDEVKGKLQRKR